MQRLDKFLSDSKVASRRELRQTIRAGRVRVGERVVREPEYKVDEKNDEIFLDGVRVGGARRIDDALRAVGMSQYAKKAPHMLSGGQKQRVAIAGVLAMKPDVIILDESTAMLDPSGRREVMNTVHRLNREEGISVVIITHYMSEAATADYMIVMDDGRIAMNGTPREVFTKVDKVRALGLDVPPMTDLAHSLRADGVDVRADVLTVDEMVEEVCRLSSNI